MKEALFRITENRKIAPLTFLMKAAGDCSGMDRPGQFVNIRIEGLFLRRPISVCDIRDDELTIIYKTVGRGTAAMSQMKPREELSMLTGLGNGYDLECSGDSPLLIGGGVGIPPLYLLARKLTQQGKRVHAVLGFNRKEEIFFEKEFRDLGCEVTVTTADGSAGVRGFVTDGLPEEYSYFYTCGPEPMLRAVKKATVTSGQFSFEERMGCGFGACMGCTCRTVTGYKRICKDGPVLEKEEILWED
ncbi:MAG: dihydroorotate dehydrogenase electron transfer subunit [Oscillospiraceae bacterium]|nr:dihydroorotate dehydrogenase electron transfer subunit [Oscillospiraceae bacterium]